MGDFTKNLSRHEFACKCGCGLNTVDFELVNVIQSTVDHFERLEREPLIVRIDSGCRCERHNNIIGGAEDSQHLWCRAGDILIHGVAPYRVYDYLDKMYKGRYGIGRYIDFTHIDTASGPARRW